MSGPEIRRRTPDEERLYWTEKVLGLQEELNGIKLQRDDLIRRAAELLTDESASTLNIFWSTKRDQWLKDAGYENKRQTQESGERA
jgi:hypothetical protein